MEYRPRMTDHLTLGQLLRTARELQNLSQEDACARMLARYDRPLTQQTLSQYERDIRRPPPEIVLKLYTRIWCFQSYLISSTDLAGTSQLRRPRKQLGCLPTKTHRSDVVYARWD